MEYKNQDENLIGELLRIKTYVDVILGLLFIRCLFYLANNNNVHRIF